MSVVTPSSLRARSISWGGIASKITSLTGVFPQDPLAMIRHLEHQSRTGATRDRKTGNASMKIPLEGWSAAKSQCFTVQEICNVRTKSFERAVQKRFTVSP
jgi:hypothetical protein